MAITLNDNIKINAGKPIESKYLSLNNTVYDSIESANNTIPISERHIGLTVNILTDEYWYKNGVTNDHLILKSFGGGGRSSDYVTGGTNLGYFSGLTGIQILPLHHQMDENYDGDYYSLYNYYYRDENGYIRIGTPTDGIRKRGYVKPDAPIKSFIWNEYLGNNNKLGWILIDGNIETLLDTFTLSSSTPYYFSMSLEPYTETGWTTNQAYNNGSRLTINPVIGSLTTGTTISIGGGIYRDVTDSNINLRTIKSKTPSLINITSDDTFIYLSGTTTDLVFQNIGTGVGVYSGISNNVLSFKTIIGSGNTTVTANNNNIVIYSSGGTETVYNLSSPAAITVGGISGGTNLLGKSHNELFEMLLFPTLNPTLTNPSTTMSLNVSGNYEIGCVIPTVSVTGNYNSGCINPQYSATCDKRSCGIKGYCIVTPNTNTYISTPFNSTTYNIPSYSVIAGSQTWSVYSVYCSGVQPYNNKGVVYDVPLPEGITPTVSSSITGILPWYWGLSSSISVSESCVVDCGREGKGGKCVSNVTASPIPIIFNSCDVDYIWFALPQCAADKTCWYVCGSNNGCIGGTGNLFSTGQLISLNSAEGCWSGCIYKLYVSCYKTGTAIGVPMCIS